MNSISILSVRFEGCFRDAQKTRFIETLLLAIPQAPILIMQRPDGMWDVYDGLERLSTIWKWHTNS